jgi:hypothetical protein
MELVGWVVGVLSLGPINMATHVMRAVPPVSAGCLSRLPQQFQWAICNNDIVHGPPNHLNPIKAHHNSRCEEQGSVSQGFAVGQVITPQTP